jgi:hypothetical protein
MLQTFYSTKAAQYFHKIHFKQHTGCMLDFMEMHLGKLKFLNSKHILLT